jgi:hypothetical protein
MVPPGCAQQSWKPPCTPGATASQTFWQSRAHVPASCESPPHPPGQICPCGQQYASSIGVSPLVHVHTPPLLLDEVPPVLLLVDVPPLLLLDVPPLLLVDPPLLLVDPPPLLVEPPLLLENPLLLLVEPPLVPPLLVLPPFVSGSLVVVASVG